MLPDLFYFQVGYLLCIPFVSWEVQEATVFFKFALFKLFFFFLILRIVFIAWSQQILQKEPIYFLLQNLRSLKYIDSFTLCKLCLGFLKEIGNNVSDVVAMVAYFSVFGRLNMDEWCIIDL